MFSKFLSSLALSAALMNSVAWAQDQNKTPLFINLSSEGQRATMALTFGTRQLEQGHPVTFFINSEGARLVSRQYSQQYAKQQEMIESLMDAGAVILVAPMFLQENGVDKNQLLPGVVVSSPAAGSVHLHKPGTQTLSW